jgi:hypothetical protein
MDEHISKRAAAEQAVASWESEGGAETAAPASEKRLAGTEQQIVWAEKIRERVRGDFDRVAAALRAVASRQSGEDLADNMAVIGILEERRQQVMANATAGYFLHKWQETKNRVQRTIAADPRFVALRKARNQRRLLEKRSS